MKMLKLLLLVGLALASLVVLSAVAQVPATNSGWCYTLVEGSRLIDDCPVCDRIPISVPMRGSFRLSLVEENVLFSTYAIEDIALVAGGATAPSYRVTGKGIYRIGGEVAVQRSLFLQLWIDNGFTNQLCYFNTNAVGAAPRLWPMLQLNVEQTNGTFVQQYHLDINAAPFREIWFSTVQKFRAGIWNTPTNTVSGGDLISSGGRVVKRNSELAGPLGIQPIVPDLGLKDADILAGGEIVFSMERDQMSESLGALHTGDLVSNKGRIFLRNPQLISAFVPQPSTPTDVGLGAVQVMDSGEIWFSVKTNFFSENLGRKIQPGDLLSTTGAVVKTGAQLIGAFKPADTTKDYGLNAVFVWPSGEIWFSTAEGFSDSAANPYEAGDLLSDQGYVVYRNAELVSAFAALESGLGLDALFVVSDAVPPRPSATIAKLNVPQTVTGASTVTVGWSGGDRVFQLEKATNAAGPYLPISPIIADEVFVDSGAITDQARGFYRVRQW